MVSSLAEQLAKGASLNANLLSEKTRRQATSESYLFSPKEARQHDLDSLHALGVNGFLQLKSLQPGLAPFEHAFFSDSAKNLDRSLQPAAQNAHLDAAIAAFLPLLGPFLLDAPTGKVLEWMVRRFRIHEFNVAPIVALFMPYHETPHFTKMVSILHISSPLRFLVPYKTTARPLHRPPLIRELLTKPDVARFILSILPEVLKSHGDGVHRALIAFHAGVILEYVAQSKALDENVMAVVLPAAMEPLQIASNPDSAVKPALLHELILGSYLALAAISQKTHLTSKAVKSLLTAVVDCADRVSPKQLVRTVVSICAPQDQLEKLPGSLIKALLAQPGLDAELVDAMAWNGADKFLVPFINHLLPRLNDPIVSGIAASILTSPSLLPAIAYSASSALIRCLIENVSTEPLTRAWRTELSQLYQRHPQIVQKVSGAFIQEDEDSREAIEQLLLSLSAPLPGVPATDSETGGLLVGTTDADASIRARAVRDLVARLSTDDIPETELQSLSSTLLLRVNDSDASVLEALYTTSPEVISRVFLSISPTAYIDVLKQALHDTGSKTPREVIRAHLTFLLSHFLPVVTASSAASAENQVNDESEVHRKLKQRVFLDILMPFLLYSKPRTKTAQAVWEILEGAEGGSLALELLGGCVDAVKWEHAKPSAANDKEGDKEGGVSVTLLTKVNLAVAAKIADNILASNFFHANLDGLLERLRDKNPHGRALAYLVVRALLARLSGEQRVNTGLRVLEAMKLDTLEGMGDFMRGVDDVSSFLDDATVGTAVVLKPSSRTTLHRLQVAVLSVLPNFPRLSGMPLRWLAEYPPEQIDIASTPEGQASRYIRLLRAVYRLSNSSATLPLLSTHLLRTLFINLGDDALAFFAGVWLTAREAEEGSVHIQYAALRHACAFLEAHVATQCTIDFQTILPAMLVMLQSPDASVRDATLRCIAVVIKLSYSAEAEAVYAFDAIYGPDSSKLQYLDWADFQKYMKAIGENRDNFVHDQAYVQIFHREHLAQSKGESKKFSGYKQRVLCYLLSHVNGCPLLSVQLSLLKSLDMVSNEAKAQVLLPTMETLLSLQHIPSPQFRELAVLVVSAFDSSSVANLNNVDKPIWIVYERLMTTCLTDDRWVLPRDALLHRLQHDLITKLNVDRKFELCRILLQVTAEHESSAIVCKKTLALALDDVALVIRLLVSLQPQPNLNTTAPPANKRARVEKIAPVTGSQELFYLASLAEVIGSLHIPGSVELVSSLLDTLHKVMSNISPDAVVRRFVEQLLMSAIENVVEHFPPSTPVPPAAIRIDALVEILRVSASPQTFHQACLLLASLARVAPDAVLHNVMPIFTFMGSNVFHRDDAYSFRVVQKTVDNIVPVMVSSLKEAHGSGLDLYEASRGFLRVFTNAANHIPRHRRVNFFSHLVDTLDPVDFLAPVSMLLVDRRSSRVVRQNATESAASLFLPLAIFERYSVELQLLSCVEFVREVQRLVNHSDSSTPPFLEETTDEEQVHADLAAKRRAIALLVFCDHALKRLRASSLARSGHERATSQELLGSFLAVSTLKPNDPSYVEVAATARIGMTSTLGVMSASDFVAGVLTILESGSVQAQGGALQLLAERLTDVSEKARRTLSPSVVKITEIIRANLASAQEATLIRSALQSLAAINNTVAPGEESAIAAATPAVLSYVSQQVLRVTALRTLLASSSRLGPRAIPYLKDIVHSCVASCRDALHDSSADPSVVPVASNVLRNLLTSIPTFWGELEVLSIVELYMDTPQVSPADAAELWLLVKAVAKQASPNVLLPALFNLWKRSLAENMKDQPGTMTSFVQVVKVSVKAASRSAVLENLRDLFETFLSMFDVCTRENSEVESPLIGAFLEVVVKLNETAFRPIFRRMFDWAFGEEFEHRQVMFCHIYTSLLDLFKALMVPYMTFTWQAFSEQLRTHTPAAPHSRLWLAVLQTLKRSLSADEDRVFWRNDKLRQIVPLAAQQIPVAIRSNGSEGKPAVAEFLTAVLSIVDDDLMIKALNLDVLMHSRSEDARIRCFSLSCAERLWRVHGDKILGFVAETVTFIAEAAEDDNDLVVREAHKLKAAVEAIGGNIDVA